MSVVILDFDMALVSRMFRGTGLIGMCVCKQLRDGLRLYTPVQLKIEIRQCDLRSLLLQFPTSASEQVDDEQLCSAYEHRVRSDLKSKLSLVTKLHSLQIILVLKGKVNEEDVKDISGVLPYIPTNLSLVMSNCGICENSFRHLIQSFPDVKCITSLNLSENQFLTAGASSLANALKHTPKLDFLSIGYNAIGDIGVKAIAFALEHTPLLRTLELQVNNISDDGATSLAAALRHIAALTSLELANNPIEIDGAVALFTALVQTPHLSYLGADSCCFGDDGVAQIKLAHVPGLERLNLNENSIGEEGASRLAQALRRFPSLQELYLGYNLFTHAGDAAAAIRAAVPNGCAVHLD